MKSSAIFPSCLRVAAFLLTCGSLSAQTTYTFEQNNGPNDIAWTQPYTLSGNVVTTYTNWNPDTSYPDGNGDNAIIGTQANPNPVVTLNANVSIQNLQLATSEASLDVNSDNSGGEGSSNVTLTLANSAAGTLQNDGAIEIDATGNSAVTLAVSNALTISGSGTLGLAAGATFSSQQTITQASTHTIQGGGGSTISAPLVNHGLITANDYGDTSENGVISQIMFPGTSITNDGTMSTTGTGILAFSGNTIANTGGLITLANTSNPSFSGFFGCELAGSVSITGGTLTSTGSPTTGIGYFRVDDAASTFSGVTLTTGTVVYVNTTLNLGGTISNSGLIEASYSNTNQGTINIPTNVTMTGDGTVYLLGLAQVTIASGATFSPGSAIIIDGSGYISGAGTLANAGTVESNVGQTLTFEPANCTNTGTLKTISGSILDLTGGTTINNAGGTISVADATSEVDFEAGVSITGGTLISAATYTGSAQGVFSVLGAMTLTNVTLTANSDITVHNALTLAGTITNNGDIVDVAAFNTDSSINLAADTTVEGTGEIILFQSTEIDATNNAVLTNGTGHTIVGAPGTINADLTNDGVLIAADSDALTQSSSSTLTNYSSATQKLSGGTYESYSTGDQTQLYLNIGSVVTNAASVIYHGTAAYIYETNTSTDPFITMTANSGGFSLLVQRQFSSSGALTNSGTITLDAGSTFHVGGAYTASGATSNLAVVIGGTANTGATSPGVLQVNGAATLAGTLALSFSAGATLPASTDTLTILSATAPVGGSFANVANGGRLYTSDEMGSFEVDYGPASVNGTMAVVLSNFEPAPTSAPGITSAASATAIEGKAFTYQITATNQPQAFAASGLPAGLKVNTSSGLISGTPTAAGKYSVMLSATNQIGKGTATLTLTVAEPAPGITSAKVATAQVGMAFSYQITATNDPTSYGVGGLFTGIKVNRQTGLISGTPNGSGTHTLTLRATNANGTGSETLTLTVDPTTPVITGPKTVTAQVGQPFSYQIKATSSPTSYGVGGLRPGLSVDSKTGLISGTPTGSGTFTLMLEADNGGGMGEQAVTLTINPTTPVITSPDTAAATVGKPFSYQIKGTSSPTSYGVGGLFEGITVDRQTGLISGTPMAAGTRTLTLRATNAGGTGTRTLTLTVVN